MKKIGFIGTGVMGKSMADHLLAAGHAITIYNRTREKALPLLERGASWAATPAEAAVDSEVVITIVGYPVDVESVYFSDNGIFANKLSGKIFIDMTTSSPLLAERIAEAAGEQYCQALDAPVSGGDIGAQKAALSIMVGGEETAFKAALPVLKLMGNNIVLQGTAGAGQRTKMCNQIAIASGMLGVCEALIYAEKSGLDANTVLKSIGGGAAGSWSLSNLAPRMIRGNYDPGFYVKHFIKDMKIALESAAEMKLELPGLQLAHKLYTLLAANGGDNLGTQALIKYYRERI